MDDKAAVEEPTEKWADRIRLFTGSPETAFEARGEGLGPFPDVYRCANQAKTAEEIAAVADVTAALNDFRRLLCGLPPLAFPTERVHVLASEEFQAKIGLGRFQGKEMLGHVYLEQGNPLHRFMALLAHEMVHAVSYLWLDVRDRSAATADGLRLPQMLQRRAGLVLIDPGYGTLLPHFHGLNEGATEMAACVIRRLVAARTTVLDDAGKRELIGFISSPPLVMFTERLIAVARGAMGDHVATSRKLFIDLMNGTDEFLKALEANLPGATEVLRATGQTPKELLVASEKLGFEDTAEFIRTFCG